MDKVELSEEKNRKALFLSKTKPQVYCTDVSRIIKCDRDTNRYE